MAHFHTNQKLRKLRRDPHWLQVMLMGLVTALTLSGCGSSLTPIQGQSEGASGWAATNQGIECNQFASANFAIAGRITSLYTNGVLQEDRVRLRLSSMTPSFSTTSGMALRFFRWKSDLSGPPQLDPTPLTFTIEGTTAAGSVAISQPLTSLGLNEVAYYRQLGIVSGTTVQDFFNNTTIVISGVDYTWNVLKVALYDGSTTTAEADTLLPIFAANPNTYAQNHSELLNQLHPFWSMRQQNLSDQEWLNRSRNWCF